MYILVTGGCGFIGSHVVDALIARGDYVHVLDDLSTGTRANLNPVATLTVGDVADEALVQQLAQDADGIIHLAAIASVPACEADPERAQRINAGGSVNVLKAAQASYKHPRVVYASSAAVYGDTATLPLNETMSPAPISIYGRDKWQSEVAAASAYDSAGVQSVGLRFFNVYGPRQDPKSPYSGVISIFANAAMRDAPITMFGDGEQTRDFIFIADIVALIIAALDAPTGAHVLNGSTGRATSLNQMAQILRDISHTNLLVTHSPARQGDIRHSLGSPNRARELLGWQATTGLSDGLAMLLASLK